MTRRERLENRAAKRTEWAEKAEAKSNQAAIRATQMIANIPAGQPILVGHHSERGHRATLRRSDNAMRTACEMGKKAENHEQKAAGIEAMLDRTIFSDDSNAVEALEARIKANEAEREKMKKINVLYRKGDEEGLKEIGIDYSDLTAKLAALGPYFGKAPHMPFEMSNLGQRITNDKKRLEQIKREQVRKEKATKSEGGILIEGTGEYIRVTFSDKPERAILNDLREAGFRWGGGSWTGQRVKLPSSVTL
jgi:hypothetical protein